MSDNCIYFANPENSTEILPNLPCKQNVFPNFNTLEFDSNAFDTYIQNEYSNKAFGGKSPFEFKKDYINRTLPPGFHLQEQ